MNYFAIIIALLLIVIILLLFLVTNKTNYSKVVVLQQPVMMRVPNQILIQQSLQHPVSMGFPRQVLLQIGNVVMHPGNTFISLKNASSIPFRIVGYPNSRYEIDKIQVTKKPYIELISYVTTDERGVASGVIQLKENENYDILISGPGIKTSYEIKVYNVESHAL
jgi:hypothetical protein